MEYKFCVFIGRFQPVHNAHLQVIRQALQEAEQLIICIGSAYGARTVKNPWSYTERMEMVDNCLTDEEMKRVHYVPLRDYYYSDSIWVTQVQEGVNRITKGEASICLIGSYKDASSYYIKYFPQWDFISAKTDRTMSATDVRDWLFSTRGNVCIGHSDLPKQVNSFILGWNACNGGMVMNDLYAEYEHLQAYKAKWASAPFPPTFVTADTVVIQSGHVLLVKRKFNPGKGLYALPGGFIKQGERIEAAAIRELKEETGIKVPSAVLTSSIEDSKVFDHPGRSLRGRTITHAFCIKLNPGELPEVKGSDDAEQAVWLPLMDVARQEERFFEDHAHIINHFISRY